MIFDNIAGSNSK